ncbi:MAG: peptidoglycan DD-metalloendopeptidase family protein [Deltaproteobacteria bacterium]|nr:peptidoglycan DD-metalloendopeptidase family protein [Deltaproteobacteria bacterium]
MQEIRIGQKELVREARPKSDEDEKLRKACKEFESVFTYELLKSMRRTIEKCDLFHGGQGEELYESLMDQELSKKMAGMGSNSLAEVLYRRLRKEAVAGEEGDAETRSLKDIRGESQVSPLSGGILTSSFGWRKDPFTGEDRFHKGIDLSAPEGTLVRAPMQGKVLMSGFRQGYGNTVVLDHGNGLTTLYAHNQENKVSEGDWVKAGDPVARVGSTGRSTGPHLHFEVRRDGTNRDPRDFLGETLKG